MVLGRGVELDPSRNFGILHVAAGHGSLAAVEMILDKGIPVDCTSNDEYEYTAQYYAANNGYYEVVEWLLDTNVV